MIWLPPPSVATSCLSFSVFLCVAGRVYLWERGRGEGGTQFIRRQERLVLYKSFNTLWIYPKRTHPQTGDRDTAEGYNHQRKNPPLSLSGSMWVLADGSWEECYVLCCLKSELVFSCLYTAVQKWVYQIRPLEKYRNKNKETVPVLFYPPCFGLKSKIVIFWI